MTDQAKPSMSDPVPHEYVASRVGHGEAQCKWCYGANRENAIISPTHCDGRARNDPSYHFDPAADALAAKDVEIARLKALLEEAKKLLAMMRGYDCPVCFADCAGANPPVSFCPERDVRAFLAKLGGDNGQG